MRYDKSVYFQKVTRGMYLDNGDYTEETIEETRCDADVIDTASKTLQILYGTLKQDSLTIRLNTHYNKPFDFIRIGNKRYKVDAERKLQHKHTFVVSEVV